VQRRVQRMPISYRSATRHTGRIRGVDRRRCAAADDIEPAPNSRRVKLVHESPAISMPLLDQRHGSPKSPMRGPCGACRSSPRVRRCAAPASTAFTAPAAIDACAGAAAAGIPLLRCRRPPHRSRASNGACTETFHVPTAGLMGFGLRARSPRSCAADLPVVCLIGDGLFPR